MIIKLKACPKCRGDLNFLVDQYGKYMSCLQCGFIIELPEISVEDGNSTAPLRRWMR